VVLERDRAFERAVAAAEAADRLWAPSPVPALTRARSLRVWAEPTRSPEARAERLAAADTAYEEAIRRAPGWPEVLDETAWVALLMGEPARALELARRAVALDEFYLPAHRTAAQALAGRGEDAAALAEYELYFADDRNGGDVPALEGYLGVLARAGESAEALDVARRLVVLVPGDAHAWADLAVLRQDGGDHAGALEAARRAAQLDPADQGIAALLAGLESP
jgi:Flp pilus assembly protein TadD